MAGFESQININDKIIKQNADAMRKMARDLKKLLSKIQFSYIKIWYYIRVP